MSTKKLSVMVPVYNVEKWLPECLDSLILPQAQEQYEIIAVNDGSTDASGEILRAYERRWPSLVRVIETENGGLGHARNTAMPYAQGEYFLFPDSDDYLPSGGIGEILALTERNADLVIFDFTEVSEEGRPLKTVRGCEEEGGSFSLRDRPELLFCPFNAWNKLCRRELYMDREVRYPPRLWFEDMATTPKLYLQAEKILPVHKSLYCYRQRAGSITKSAKAPRNLEMTEVLHSVVDWFRETGNYERYEKELCYMGFYHEMLTSVVRVNLLDESSPVQTQLRDDYLALFPDYRQNPYYRKAPVKYHFLDGLIRNGQWKLLHRVMAANEKRKER